MVTEQRTVHGSVAIVGSGPSGCYTAAALRKSAPEVEIVVFDSLHTPYGLVRHGIAPDHQGMKAVTRQFDRIFADGHVRFVGGVHIGRDLTLSDLQNHFDAVVVATGLPEDRPLSVPGADLPGVVGSGEIVRLLNAHPFARLRTTSALPKRGLGSEIAIIGTGNVAIDVVRLLAKSRAELHGSDVDDGARDLLRPDQIRRVRIFGRGPATAAKWDPSMLRELAGVARIDLTIDGVAFVTESATVAPTSTDATAEPLLVDVQFDFTLEQLTSSAAGALEVHGHGRDMSSVVIEADTVITAIGFVDTAKPIGDVDLPVLSRRVRTVGGCGTGVLGSLAQNRKAGQEAAAAILKTLGTLTHPRSGWSGLSARVPSQHTDYVAWKRIDEAEQARAGTDRCRRKFSTQEELLAAAFTAAP
ncbi:MULTISPECIES: FAD-dependent oxidoreductase [unclassified Curtobacterium]|uniref:FAD-dependent oxidoreductase n=1 Tax=unclassified Curtobacterium TaxID=257496 RepID=UPI003A80A2B4